MRLRLVADSEGGSRFCELEQPFRLGFGEQCDIRLEGGSGPEVLFQVERARGPVLVARAVAPTECANYVDLRLDGEPLQQAVQGLAAGSHLEIRDKHSGRRYQVTVESSLRRGGLRPRNLATIMLVLAVAGAGFGGYLYWTLKGARTELSRTETRVRQAEADLAIAEGRLRQSLERIENTEAALSRAVDELRLLAEASARSIREEFTSRIQQIERSSQAAIATLTEQDAQGRARLQEQARRQAAALREEFSDRMVESYQRQRALEQRLLQAMAERLAGREPEGQRFKRVFEASAGATLVIRTSYKVVLMRDNTVQETTSFGTGFVISPTGKAITAQHVLFPWRHDVELVMLAALGLVRVMPESVRWQAWPQGARVLRDPGDEESVDETTAYGSHAGLRPLRLLHAPPPEVSMKKISSPLGVIDIPIPVPGPSDSAVLQIMAFDQELAHVPVSGTTPAPLDEVLLVGYPFSLLQDGVATPQAVRGFVRRLSADLMELDAAVHPGLSGGPVFDRDGAMVGMVMATLNSEVYGVALPASALRDLLDATREQVLEEEARLAAAGCDPGEVDGEFDAHTWAAYQCAEAAAGAAKAPG